MKSELNADIFSAATFTLVQVTCFTQLKILLSKSDKNSTHISINSVKSHSHNFAHPTALGLVGALFFLSKKHFYKILVLSTLTLYEMIHRPQWQVYHIMANDHHGVLNYWSVECLFNSLFKLKTKNFKGSCYCPFVRGIHRIHLMTL